MAFASNLWRVLVAIKDGLALLFLLLFFIVLFGVLSSRPNPGSVREGALLLKLDGSIVEEPSAVDPFAALTSGGLPAKEYRARDLVRALDAAAKDEDVKAVVLDLSSFTGGGLVNVMEVAEALDRVKAAKKPVLAHAFAYADDSLMLAAHASEVWVDPLGGAFVLGPGGHNLYFGKLLERFKVTPHVYRVGTYKDFVEPYLRSDMSPEARAAREAVIGAVFEQWKADVAKARPQAKLDLVTKEPAAWYRASGGDGAEAAKTAGLVDRIGDRVAFGKRVAEVSGKDVYDARPGSFAHSTLRAYLAANPEETPGKKVGVITIAGNIVDGKAGPGTAGGDRIAELLDGKEGKDLAALVVRVDSPGGSVTASERIRQAIERQKAKGIPVVVSMGNVAASGGYWVSTPASRIFAEPGTITGSIGIFAVIASFEKALAEYGVTTDGVRSTPLSGQPDLLGGFTPELDGMLQSNIERGYQRFTALVGQSRKLSPEQVDAVAQGRVWDGGTARQKGLVDEFGGLDDALAYAARQAKLGDGDWHPVFLGAKDKQANSLLLALLAGGDDDEDSVPPEQGDLFAMVAERQQAVLARLVSDAQRLVASRGMQAYCLDCPAQPLSRQQKQGLIFELLREWGKTSFF
ncbi:signal peptide peptidase SppA [Novosphingobium sp. TH158]|uniref:signal peptide peptidase SppA n=1 Tax=Novosphingobium sp. TH158 TaxID=2067455 RepID=UPI000C7DBD68|nr:signal peptide peptidase SppA [Novosphingobium sp. TH158]PLK24224.1 signal peptide peptidase SppA [Novosphingobium sp. TH158]